MKHGKTSFLNLPAHDGGTAAPEHGSVWPIESWLIQRLMQALGNPPIRVVLWDGEEHYRGASTPAAEMHIRDRAIFWHLLSSPNMAFGDGYSLARIEVEGSLVDLLEAIFRARLEKTRPSPVQRFITRGLFQQQRRNSLAGSQDNIAHHYDLSNDFYQLWLDTAAMQYTCAYFPTPEASLEAAQLAKLDHVARKLRLQPGETVVEAGCGWGGLARHFARHYGVKVRAYNISKEQVAFAREKAKAEGLEDRVEYVLDDYRNITGDYDVFVSVGMLEHVGAENYQGLGQVIDRALKDNGRGLVHTIGQLRPEPTGAWTEKRLFPGGYAPTLKQIMDIFEEPGFSILDVENIRLHYAKTLEHWLGRYERNLGWVREHFDEFFVRAWRLYLAGSMANFSAGVLQLYQVNFARPTRNDIAWTRAHLYL